MGYTGEKKRAYQRAWMARRRKEWFDKNGPCKCGSRERLELDHIDPDTKITHAVWSWSKVRREKELSKCQVLCNKCHLGKTLDERPKTGHGTGQMYQKYKCRCNACRAYKTTDNAKRDRRRIRA